MSLMLSKYLISITTANIVLIITLCYLVITFGILKYMVKLSFRIIYLRYPVIMKYCFNLNIYKSEVNLTLN